MNRIGYLDFFKGICILGVICHHLSNHRLPDLYNLNIAALASVLSWCVYGFIHASAVLGFNEGSGLARLRERAERLMIPYFVLGFGYCLLWAVMHWSEGAIEVFVDSIRRLVLFRDPIGEQLYFLPLLFLVTGPWCFLGYFNRILLSLLCLIGVALIFFIFHLWQIPLVLGRGITVFNLILAFGVFSLGVCYSEVVACMSIYRVNLIVLILLIIAFLSKVLLLTDVLCLLILPMAICHLIRISDLRGIVFTPLFWLGRRSAWIYAFHTPFVIYSALVIGLNFKFSLPFVVLLMILASVIIPFLIGKAISGFYWRRYFLV